MPAPIRPEMVLVVLVLALLAATALTLAVHRTAAHPSAGYIDGGQKPHR